MNNIKYFVIVLVVVALGFVFWNYKGTDKEVVVVPPVVEQPATVSTVSVLDAANSGGTAAAINASSKTINWKTTNYPSDVGVNINLVRKVSDSPKTFELVRVLATDTPNDGQEAWVPGKGEKTDDLYIEVTCSGTSEFNAGCSLASEPVKVN
ncbi:hypothetical protein HZA26_00670 [Candidatus Nomurabacteria bacterium]|nr:hypothetical protein [Candidatus Nomurabacteria bacterium]